MKVLRSYGLVLILVCIAMIMASCGKSDDSGATSTVYTVAYVPGTDMNAPVQGKTTFQLAITKTIDGSPATGLTPRVSFLMNMNNRMQHSTPADLVSESTTTPGTYNCTAYYLMASGPTMGTWTMNVNVAGEIHTFNPNVAMAMGSDTVVKSLYGTDDIATGMSSTNYYYVFRDGMLSASMPTLKLYISHGENMRMSFVPASAGSVLTSPTYTISTMSVQASLNGGTTWTTGTDNTKGHWSISGLMGLASGVTSTIQVKVTVNGQVKTADGTTDYATFIVTPQ